MKRIILTFAITVLFSGHLLAGGWNQPEGHGFFKLGQSFVRADRFFSEPGVKIDLRTTGVYTTHIYAEYGVTDWFTGVVYFPFFVRSTLNGLRNTATGEEFPGGSLNSIGDMEVGLKFRLLKDKPVVMSSTLTFGFPSGKDDGTLQNGLGIYTQTIMFDVGYSLKNQPFYMNAAFGFRNMTNEFSEELRFAYEMGYTVRNQFTAALKFTGVYSFQNEDGASNAAVSVFSNNMQMVGLAPEVSYTLNGTWGFSASVMFVPWGSRILSAPFYNFGLVYLLKR